MKLNCKRLTALLSAVAGSLLLMQDAQAQFSYTSRDMLLTLRKTGSDGVGTVSPEDLEINIGQASLYYGATPGGTFTVTQLDPSKLSSVFDNINDLSWSVSATVPAAGDSGDSSKPVKTLWATAPRSDINTSAQPWTRFSATSQGGTSGKIKSALDNAVFYGTTVASGPNNTSSLIVIPTGSGHEAGAFLGSFGNWNGTFQGDVENTTASNFTTAGQPSRSDLYELLPSTSGGNGKLLGYFQLNTDGTLTFTALAVPTITSNPASQTVANGANNVVFSAGVSGDNLSYQWSFNGSALSDDGTTINGSQTSSLTLTSVTDASAGTYSLTAVNDAGSVSASATLVVSDAPVIVTQPQSASKQFEGTSETLTVGATGGALQYQWYQDGIAINGANAASYTFPALLAPSSTDTNVTYYVVVSNPAGTVTSANATISIVIDKKKPTLTLTSPIKNTRAPSFEITGVAKDTTTNIAYVKYVYSNTWTHFVSPAPIIAASASSKTTQLSFDVTGDMNATAGTNILTVWAEDFAGNASVSNSVALFFQQTSPFTLTILGDGNGTVTGTTKGAKNEQIDGIPATASKTLNLYLGQTYTFTYQPDSSSTVSNAPNMNDGVAQTKKFVGQPFIMQVGASATVSFNRNRLLDMIGKYNGIFSVDNDPEIASAGMLNNLNVAKSGAFSAHILNNGVKVPISGKITPSGDIIAANGNLLLTAKLLWTGSENPAERQISGSVSNIVDGWNATLVAYRMDTNVTLTAGNKEVMVIPPGTSGPIGSSFANITDAASTRTFKFTLADGGVASLSGMGSSTASNVVIFVNPSYKDGSKSALFGVWNAATNFVTLNWVKAPGGSVIPNGFNVATTATNSPFTSPGLTGTHTVTISGGGLSSDLTFANVPVGTAKTTVAGVGTVILTVSATGEATVTFASAANLKKSYKGFAGVLTSENNGGGFFSNINGTGDTGSITITP